MTSHNGDATTAELLRRLSDQANRLVHDEMELARSELAQKGRQAGVGAGMLGGAAIFSLFGIGALTAAAIVAFDLFLALWLAALAVAAIWFVIAGILALVGRTLLPKAVPPVPERTIASVRADVTVARERARSARA